MIACPVCGSENHHLAVVCRSCGSYVQSKIDTINLFSMIWNLIESPGTAFRRIAMATHKNYVFLLGCGLGIGLVFGLMWQLKVGNSDLSLLHILAAGVLVGPAAGIVTLLVLAGLQMIVAAVFRHPTRFKNVLAITAYAAVPITFSVVFVLPIEVLTFGKFMFSTNPSPVVIKPVSYVVLLGLDAVCLVWSVVLYVIGVRVLYDVRTARAVLLSGIVLALFGASLAFGLRAFMPGDGQPEEERLFTAAPASERCTSWNE